jgi:glucose-1-phosphate cytidylyltransferase
MKVIILAGGRGSRISEETSVKPKPMVLINNKPLLWHIMNIYSKQGFIDFVIATGYKGEVINDWINTIKESWRVQTLDTGIDTQTGGRIKKCINYLKEDNYLATYGDGLSNVNLSKLITQHSLTNTLVTLTAVQPPARFGYLNITGTKIEQFTEKKNSSEPWINGGFFVINKKVADYISNDNEPFETTALPKLAREGNLHAYKHEGFWQHMDTLHEKSLLEKYALQTPAPWLLGL